MISMNPLDVGLKKRDEKAKVVAKVLYSKEVPAGFYRHRFTNNKIELERVDSKSDATIIIPTKKNAKLFYLMYVSGEIKIMPVKESYVEYE